MPGAEPIDHKFVSHKKWVRARTELLKREKEFTQRVITATKLRGSSGHNPERGPICACRRNAASPQSAAPARRLARRSSSAVSWALPSLGLALVPKCPMCIAAYLALGGGLGVSLSTASHLRIALLWLCWSVLALLTVRLAARFAKTRIMARTAAFASVASSIPLRRTMYGYIKQGHRQQI